MPYLLHLPALNSTPCVGGWMKWITWWNSSITVRKYAHALLPVWHLRSRTTNCQLPTANYQLPTANYQLQLPTANYQLPTANYQLPTTNWSSTQGHRTLQITFWLRDQPPPGVYTWFLVRGCGLYIDPFRARVETRAINFVLCKFNTVRVPLSFAALLSCHLLWIFPSGKHSKTTTKLPKIGRWEKCLKKIRTDLRNSGKLVCSKFIGW